LNKKLKERTLTRSSCSLQTVEVLMGLKLLIILGTLFIGIGYYLLMPPPDAQYGEVLQRVVWGLGFVFAGGATLTLWLYKR